MQCFDYCNRKPEALARPKRPQCEENNMVIRQFGLWMFLWYMAAALPASGADVAEESTNAPEGGEKAPAALYEKLQHASVMVLVNGRMSGSGTFIDARGVVLTAAHVVLDKKKRIEIVTSEKERMPAACIAHDYGHDIALLKVESASKRFPVLKPAEAMPPPASEVLLISSPLWRHHLLLKGFVARLKPTYCWHSKNKCYVRCFYIAGASPLGSSGGAWVDRRGRIVGVQSGYLNNSDKSPVGIAFCAPVDAVRGIVENRKSSVTTTLGGRLEELWTQSEGFLARLPEGKSGIVTPVLNKGGALKKAGLTKETIILEIEGTETVYLDDLLDVVRSKEPGDKVILNVIEPIGKPPHDVEVILERVKH